MWDKKLNNVQNMITSISGYEPDKPKSAQDDFYYDECKTPEEKTAHILDYALNFYDVKLTLEEVLLIYIFLKRDSEDDFNSDNERWIVYENLGAE